MPLSPLIWARVIIMLLIISNHVLFITSSAVYVCCSSLLRLSTICCSSLTHYKVFFADDVSCSPLLICCSSYLSIIMNIAYLSVYLIIYLCIYFSIPPLCRVRATTSTWTGATMPLSPLIWARVMFITESAIMLFITNRAVHPWSCCSLLTYCLSLISSWSSSII